NKENAGVFFSKASQIKSDDAVVVAYQGVAFTLKAKYEKELSKKKSNFKKGAEMLEGSIQKDPQNIELRTLRLSVQENSPKILNYNKNIEEDKKVILANFSKSKSEVKTFVSEFASASKSFSEQEKKTLKP